MRNRPVDYLFFATKLALFAASFMFMVINMRRVLGAIMTTGWKPILFVDAACLLLFLCVAVRFSLLVFWDISNIVHGMPIVGSCLTNTDHGDEPETVALGICEERVAHLALFTQDGKKLTEATNYDSDNGRLRIGLATYYEENPGCCELYNHPDFPSKDRPFLPDEVANAMDYGVSGSYLVTQDSLYYLRLPRQYTPEEARRARWIMKRTVGLFPSHERRIRACKKVAKEFDMEFEHRVWEEEMSELEETPTERC